MSNGKILLMALVGIGLGTASLVTDPNLRMENGIYDDMEVTTYQSDNNFTKEAEGKLQTSTSDVMSVLYVVIGVLGITGNLTVILVMTNSTKMRKTIVNMYIVNQSCLDFVISVLVVSLNNHSGAALTGTAGVLYCYLWQSRVFLFGFMASSSYNLVFLTIERYLGLVHPMWHMVHFTKTKAVMTMLFAWVFGFSTEAAQKFAAAKIVDGQCIVYLRWPSLLSQSIYGSVNIFYKLIFPVLVLVYCYVRIIFTLHKQISGKNLSDSDRVREEKLQAGKENTIKTLLIVAICFFICWAGNQIAYYRYNLGYPLDFASDEIHVTIIMIYVNCCVNPFVYALKYHEFQRAAVHLFCCGRISSSENESDSKAQTQQSELNADDSVF